MKTNIFKTGIALIIAIACSYSLISNDKSSDNWQSSDDYLTSKNSHDKSSDDYQISKINQRVNPLVYKKDNIQNSDSGWVQKDGYLENALQVGSISFFRYSNDGQYLFTFGSDYTFRKWDVKTGMVVKKIDYIFVHSFDMNIEEETIAILQQAPNGDNLFIYKNDSIICSTDIFKYYKIPDYCSYDNQLLCFCNKIKQININFNGSCFSSGTYHSNGAYFSWDYDSNKLDDSDFFDNVLSMVASKNGKYILVSSYSDYNDEDDDEDYRISFCLTIKFVDNYDKKAVDSRIWSEPYHSLSFSNNSKYLSATRGEKHTFVWDIENKGTKYFINIPNLKYTQFTADDRFLITTLEKPDTSIIKFFLAETGVEADSIYFASKSHNGILSVSPDSVNIAIAGIDGRIRIFQPKIFTTPFKTYFAADSIFKQLGNAIQFSDYSLPNATSWHWDFGDGETSNEQNPIHYYNAKGLYTVKLISSNGIQTDTMVKKDYIRMLIPLVADFSASITRDTIPFTVQFINKSQGDITSYKWIINNYLIHQEENPVIKFIYWGDFDVSLIVSDGYFSDTLFIKEKIQGIPPTIPFFTNKLEKRFVQDNQTFYGIDGIQTYDRNFVFIANIFDVETNYYDEEYHYNEKYRNKLLIKMDNVGNIIWDVISDSISKILKTVDSCYITVGNCTTPRNLFTIKKFNRYFELIWEKTYDNKGSEIAMDACIDEDGGILIIGCSLLNKSFKTVVLKVDKDGNQLWYKTFGGIGGSVINTKDKNILLIIDYADKHQIILKKLNEKGNDVWQKSVGENVYPKNSMLLNNNEILISGYKGNADNNIKYNPYLIKVDSSGNKLWEYVGVETLSYFNDFVNLSDSLFILAGNFNSKIGLQIINNQGELVNSVRFPERVGEIKSIVTTKDNDLFLTGSITPPYKLSQLYTLLLKHPYIITSVEEEQTENIANPELPFSIFPNPTNSTATLQYKIETPTNLKIEIIDFMGTKVSEIENSFKESGEYNTLINFESLTIAKGIYFLRFIANGHVFVSKVIYL